MVSNQSIRKLEELNKRIQQGSVSDVFLREIRTVKFRNFPAGGKIEFRSPITAVVGTNGMGKTTVLHLAACAFAPPSIEGKRTAGMTFNQFIPDSQKDKMVIGSRYGFVYGNNDENEYIWIDRGGARVGEREWDRVKRQVRKQRTTIFLGFEKNISNPLILADYFDLTKRKRQNRLDAIGKNASELTALSKEHVEKIGHICDKHYRSIERRTDNFSKLGPNCPGYVVDGRYSDIASGSGEIAIIRIVDSVLSAPKNSIIVIDEPESGAHPVAQQHLLEFFIEEALGKSHQFVFTTHSQFMLEALSPSSIVLLKPAAGSTTVIPTVANRLVALKSIGDRIEPKHVAIVEDNFAKAMLEQILESDPATNKLVTVQSADAEGWVPMVQNEFPRDFGTWKYAKKPQQPIFILDGDVQLKIDLKSLEDTLGSRPKLEAFEKEYGLQKLILKIARFSGKVKRVNFKSIFRHYKQELLLRMIEEYLYYFQRHLVFLPGAVPPEVVFCEWIFQQLQDSDSSVSNHLKSLPEHKRDDFIAQMAPPLPSDYGLKRDACKGRVHYLSCLDPPPVSHLLCYWTADVNNSSAVGDIVERFREIIGN